jgi:hypothetical protein
VLTLMLLEFAPMGAGNATERVGMCSGSDYQ